MDGKRLGNERCVKQAYEGRVQKFSKGSLVLNFYLCCHREEQREGRGRGKGVKIYSLLVNKVF